MSEAFTVRLRVNGGRHSFWIAPAGGMGLSFPCCAEGHDTSGAALEHGTPILADAFHVPRLRPAS